MKSEYHGWNGYKPRGALFPGQLARLALAPAWCTHLGDPRTRPWVSYIPSKALPSIRLTKHKRWNAGSGVLPSTHVNTPLVFATAIKRKTLFISLLFATGLQCIYFEGSFLVCHGESNSVIFYRIWRPRQIVGGIILVRFGRDERVSVGFVIAKPTPLKLIGLRFALIG